MMGRPAHCMTRWPHAQYPSERTEYSVGVTILVHDTLGCACMPAVMQLSRNREYMPTLQNCQCQKTVLVHQTLKFSFGFLSLGLVKLKSIVICKMFEYFFVTPMLLVKSVTDPRHNSTPIIAHAAKLENGTDHSSKNVCALFDYSPMQ